MKKRFLFLVLAILSIFTLIGCGDSNAKVDGNFTIEVVDENEKSLCNEKIGFKTGDNLVELLKTNEKVKLAGDESEYGLYVTSICGKKAADAGETYYWSLYVNEEVSSVGISSVELKDGLKIKFVLVDWTKETW